MDLIEFFSDILVLIFYYFTLPGSGISCILAGLLMAVLCYLTIRIVDKIEDKCDK
jgi:hypothetical protein